MVIRVVQTREELAAIAAAGRGYLYNDFGGTRPRDCLIHKASCEWVQTMLDVPPGALGVKKLWSDSLSGLVDEVRRRGKVYAPCSSEDDVRLGIAQRSGEGDAG